MSVWSDLIYEPRLNVMQPFILLIALMLFLVEQARSVGRERVTHWTTLDFSKTLWQNWDIRTGATTRTRIILFKGMHAHCHGKLTPGSVQWFSTSVVRTREQYEYCHLIAEYLLHGEVFGNCQTSRNLAAPLLKQPVLSLFPDIFGGAISLHHLHHQLLKGLKIDPVECISTEQ